MSAAKIITDLGAAVALVGGKVKLSGLDRLPAEVAAQVVEVARERREELRRELDLTGLGWVPAPGEVGAPGFAPWWAAFDLADICRLYGMRIAAAGNRLLAIYPPELEAELVAYASELLDQARPFLAANLDKLPILTPAEAVEIVKDIMRRHRGLRFIRGEGGSMWPAYPPTWTPAQKATLQSVWLSAGEALDRADFRDVDA